MQAQTPLRSAIAIVEDRRHTRVHGLAALALCLLAAACASPSGAAAAGPGALEIHVVSNRADLISGGDALVAVDLPRSVRPSQVRMELNGSNVTREFAMRADGGYEGELEGLRLGGNVLSASVPGAQSDHAAIRNHPNGGPVLSGPQVQPWVCQNGSKSPKCDAPTTYEYEYKSSVDGGLHPYDPEDPPSDVAKTTTQTGQTVPFIIRVETG